MKKISRKIGNELEDFVGAMSDPSKADKTEVGNLATLTTTDKTSLVGAVNEVNAGLATKADETEVAAIENVYGSKNLLLNNAVTQTINGVTFTVNSDGSVTANGTAPATISFRIKTDYFKPDDQKTYILNGCPNGGSQTTYMIHLYYRNSSGASVGVKVITDSTQEIVCKKSDYANTEYFDVLIIIDSGTTVSNLTFKPMIRDARISDTTYVPYAMTNRELTEEITSIEPTVGKSIKATNSAWAGTTLTFSNITAVNNVMYRFTALRNDGGYCEYILINRADGIKSGKIAGNVDCTFTINGTTLTVTFASTGYWCYQLVKLNNYN